MHKDYQIDEDETEIVLHIPPASTLWKVVFGTFLFGFSLWYSAFCIYIWLYGLVRFSEAFLQISMYLLMPVTAAALRMLYLELNYKTLRFERHVITVENRLLGIRVQHRWINSDWVQAWSVKYLKAGLQVRVSIRFQDEQITLIDHMDCDLWTQVLTRMQRKEFAYV